MVKLNYLQEYVLLAETLNFSKTAEMSFITQPALSRHISIIENEMGAKLFERTTRSVKLTSAGETVYEAFKYILTIYQQTQKKAHKQGLSDNQRLVISSPYYWTGDYTEPLIRRFRNAYPDCEVEIHSCQPHEGWEELKKSDCDIFISNEMADTVQKIKRVPFEKEEVQLFMRSDNPLAEKEAVDFTDMQDEKYIYIRGYEYWRDRLLMELSDAGIFPSEVIRCNQIDELGMVIQKENGLAFMAYSVRHMNRSYIVSRPFREKYYIDMFVYYRQDTENHMVKELVSMLNQANMQ